MRSLGSVGSFPGQGRPAPTGGVTLRRNWKSCSWRRRRARCACTTANSSTRWCIRRSETEKKVCFRHEAVDFRGGGFLSAIGGSTDVTTILDPRLQHRFAQRLPSACPLLSPQRSSPAISLSSRASAAGAVPAPRGLAGRPTGASSKSEIDAQPGDLRRQIGVDLHRTFECSRVFWEPEPASNHST